MENIYGQDEHVRNGIVSIPDNLASDAGNTLYRWLGSLWRGLHQGDELVRGLQEVRGIRLAQLYINILESLHLQDRQGAPVFHRELWHPIAIRKSQRDTAQENLLTLGGDERKIGPQPSGSEYGEGTVFQIGKMANFEHYVTYPVSADIAGGALTIVDNIVNPKVFLERGVDFEIRNNTIIFHRDNDPLASASAFERYDLPDILDEAGNKKAPDIEAVLWASDVLIDKNYLADHISYALGAYTPSSDVVKRILNAAWSATSCGLTPELMKTLIAAMLNVPVIQNETETVVDITTEADAAGNLSATVVHTDAGIYRISPKARLIKGIHAGSVLKRGDFLDETVRVYPFLNTTMDKDTGFSIPLEMDIPSVVLPPSVLRVQTKYGVYAMWQRSVVRQSATSPVDASGNPHLYFDIGGTDADVSAFWNDVWDAAEKKGVSMASVIGSVGTLVSPAEFFLRHLVGANTLFVVIDRSQADDVSMMRNPMFYDMLSDVVPSAIRLFLVEHDAVGEDRMDMGGMHESTFLAAALPRVEEYVEERAQPGGRNPSFWERVAARFIRPSPKKVRGRKEEE